MVEENDLSAAQKKLFELRMRVNAGRKANKTVSLCIYIQNFTDYNETGIDSRA